MDMMTVNMPQVAPTQTAATQATAQTGTQTADVSFAQLLMGLSGNTGATQTTADGAELAEGLTWRELQGMQTAANAPLSADLSDLLALFKEISGEDDDQLKQLLEIIEQMQNKLQLTVGQQGGEMAGQQLLALMNGMMDGSLQITSEDDLLMAALSGNTQPLLDKMLSLTPEEAMQLLTGNGTQMLAETDTADAFMQAMLAQFNAATPATAARQQAAQPQQVQQAAAPIETAAMPTEAVAATAEQQVVPQPAAVQAAETAQISVVEVQHEKAPAQPEAEFDESIRAAKELLAKDETAPAQPKQETDIDALQKQVDTGAYLRNTALASTAPAETESVPEEAPAMRAQVEEGILTGIRKGQEEFSIKLKPEGLGELTVKLAKNSEGFMSLSIIAKNAETAKNLAGEIDQLRQNLQSMKVEVDSILTEKQYELLSQQQSFEQQRQNWQGQQLKGPAYYGDEPLGSTDTAIPEMQPAAQTLGTAALDTYI